MQYDYSSNEIIHTADATTIITSSLEADETQQLHDIGLVTLPDPRASKYYHHYQHHASRSTGAGLTRCTCRRDAVLSCERTRWNCFWPTLQTSPNFRCSLRHLVKRLCLIALLHHLPAKTQERCSGASMHSPNHLELALCHMCMESNDRYYEYVRGGTCTCTRLHAMPGCMNTSQGHGSNGNVVGTFMSACMHVNIRGCKDK